MVFSCNQKRGRKFYLGNGVSRSRNANRMGWDALEEKNYEFRSIEELLNFTESSYGIKLIDFHRG